jgi:hypothetical protein
MSVFAKKHGEVNCFIPLMAFAIWMYCTVENSGDTKSFTESPCGYDKWNINWNLHLFGFKWKQLYYVDKCLPMGCSSSCQIYERFSSSLHSIGQFVMPDGLVFHILVELLSFTESPCGYDKWNINWNLPFSFFGHNPKEQTLTFLQGL